MLANFLFNCALRTCQSDESPVRWKLISLLACIFLHERMEWIIYLVDNFAIF